MRKRADSNFSQSWGDLDSTCLLGGLPGNVGQSTPSGTLKAVTDVIISPVDFLCKKAALSIAASAICCVAVNP